MLAPMSARRALTDPPGGVLLWIVVVLELVAFSMVFGVLAHLRSADPATFAAGQAHLDASQGLVLTLVLLVSGWLVAEAVHAHRAGELARARRFAWGGVASGTAFVVLKALDYAAKREAGHWLGAGDFWDAYVLATGFHFVHVLVGLSLLAYVASRLGRGTFDDPETAVAGSGLFWHMCDVAWLFLFPLLYART